MPQEGFASAVPCLLSVLLLACRMLAAADGDTSSGWKP